MKKSIRPSIHACAKVLTLMGDGQLILLAIQLLMTVRYDFPLFHSEVE